jgi:hypothetical protein
LTDKYRQRCQRNEILSFRRFAVSPFRRFAVSPFRRFVVSSRDAARGGPAPAG